LTLTDRLSTASPLVSFIVSVCDSPHYRGAPFRKSQTSGFSVTHGRTYAYTGDCFPQLHTLLHILQYVYEGGHEDVAAVGSAKAEASAKTEALA